MLTEFVTYHYFLGLRNLTVLADAVEQIREKDSSFTLAGIPDDDPATYEMLMSGKTSGVFQMESAGITSVCTGLKPQSIEDITAIIALYRPGPMDSIPRFIACKQDASKIRYLHPLLQPILSVTYGCIVYQEQVIDIFRQLGGYSLGQADMVRRAISKKKVKEIEKEKQAFIHGDSERGIAGCVQKGISAEVAEAIYGEIYDFANYAFNKAHAVSYAVVAYQTAYCKCHYTKEYMAALLTSVLDSSEKVSDYIGACKEWGIPLLPPDINRSADRFTVEADGIRFGLVAVKNIGSGYIQAVMQERKKRPFRDLQDYCTRMDGIESNKRGVENLIRCGAFDSTGAKRSQLLAVYEQVMDGVADSRRRNMEGQLDFFSGFSGEEESYRAPELPDIPEYTAFERMMMERETTGLFLTGHPMQSYRRTAERMGAVPLRTLREDCNREEGAQQFHDEQKLCVAGVVTACKLKPTKKNTMMAYVTIDDGGGVLEMLCFQRTLEQFGSYLRENQVIYAQGRLSMRDEKTPQLLCDFVAPLEQMEELERTEEREETLSVSMKVLEEQSRGKVLFCKVPSIESAEFRHLQLVLSMFPGDTPVQLRLGDTNKRIELRERCILHPALLMELRETVGEKLVAVLEQKR